MEINYLGGGCFRIREKNIYLLLGNPGKKTEADLVLVNEGLEEAKKMVSSKNRKKPFFISRPGEYEIAGVEIWGQERGYWQIRIGEWRLCFLVDGEKKFDDKKVDSLGQVEILFLILPKNKQGIKRGAELIKRISPLIAVPGLGENGDSGLDWEKDFLDAVDQENLKPEPKLVISRKELPEETKIVLLKSKYG